LQVVGKLCSSESKNLEQATSLYQKQSLHKICINNSDKESKTTVRSPNQIEPKNMKATPLSSTITTVTTESTLSHDLITTTEPNYSHDKKTNSHIDSLSMNNENGKHPKTLSKGDEESNISYLDANWLDVRHLLLLNKAKNKLKNVANQQDFLEMAFKDQLIKTIELYTLSDLKMVYMRYCVCLQQPASMDIIMSTPKIKEGLKDLIWNNRTFLR